MRKIQILGLAVFAVFACSAVAASSAFAESEWLVGGGVITTQVAVENETIGPIRLIDLGTVGGASEILCEAVLSLGFVGETVNGVFNPKLDLVETVAFMNPCTIDSGPCTSLDSVLPVNLTWLTEILLVNSVFLDHIVKDDGVVGAPGYLVECNTFLGLMDDACTTELGSVDLDNAATDVVALFNEPPEAERANCTQGGNLKGVVLGEVLVFTESGLSLQVS